MYFGVMMMRPTLKWTCSFVLFCVILLANEIESADKPAKAGFEVHVEHKPPDCKEESAVGDRVKIHYTGKLDNGQIFDSSIKRQREPIGLTLGAGQVIEGWEKGLLGMCVGEKRQLVIPASMGYGDAGYPPVIPGGATLHFEVNMVSLEKGTEVILAASVWNVMRLLAVPTILVVVVYVLYTRYNKEMLRRQDEKKQSKRRR